MDCELSNPSGSVPAQQTKGSAEVAGWKGDSGQMLENPFACYLSSSKNSSGWGRQAVHTHAWVWNPLPLDTGFKASSLRGSQ